MSIYIYIYFHFMKPSFIYFDLDNTLLDHTSAEMQAQLEIHKSFDEFRSVTLQAWLETYRVVNQHLWEQYQKGEVDRFELQRARFRDSMIRLDLTHEKSEEIGETYMELYRKYWNWLDGAKEAFVELSGLYDVGIITNGFKETQQKKFDKMGLSDYCEVMIISEEIGELKPHPKVFDTATEQAKVSRDKILYVGDSYSSDIVGGRNAGWKTAWYTAMSPPVEEDQTADFRFERFEELVDLLS